MKAFNDITGYEFGRLTVISRIKNKHNQYVWVCKCNCGNETVAAFNKLKSGAIKSCGCYGREIIKKCSITHGLAKSSEYRSWDSMKQRCYNKNNNRYKNYGERGIKVCDRWLNSFENFLEDMGQKPSRKHTLDRLDNKLGYCKNNCRWLLNIEQQRNQTKSVFIEYNGEKMIQTDWERKFNVCNGYIYAALKRGNKKEDIFKRLELRKSLL